MKKLTIILATIAMIALIGCSGPIMQKKAEPIYEKYQDNGDFLRCYNMALGSIEDSIENPDDEIPQEMIDMMKSEAVRKEFVANNCLGELAVDEENKTLCQDLYIDKTKPFYEFMYKEESFGASWMGLPLTTEEIIKNCKESVDKKYSARSRASSAYWQTSDIAITSTAISASGDVMLKTRNNMRSTITISSVKVDGKELLTEPYVLRPGQSTNTPKGSFGAEICAQPGDSFSVDAELKYTDSETGAIYTFTGDGNKLEGTCAV